MSKSHFMYLGDCFGYDELHEYYSNSDSLAPQKLREFAQQIELFLKGSGPNGDLQTFIRSQELNPSYSRNLLSDLYRDLRKMIEVTEEKFAL